MSAAVCGSKRSYFFDDMQPSSPPSAKKLRCGSSSPSPVRLSPPRSVVLDNLKSQFPQADPEVLERVVAECGNDLEAGLKILREHSNQPHDGSAMGDLSNATERHENKPLSSAHADGDSWVDLLMMELVGVATFDDAKSRVSAVLECFETSLNVRKSAVTEAVVEGVQKENHMLKKQIEAIIHENNVLKRAVAIQYERQKGLEDKDRELVHLKEMVSHYQEQVRTLEMNNYTLSMHLRQAQQANPIIGRFNPDVF